MKSNVLILMVTFGLITFYGCKNNGEMQDDMTYNNEDYEDENEDEDYMDDEQYESKNVSYSTQSNDYSSGGNSSNSLTYKIFYEKDPQGKLFSTVEMPQEWRYEGPVIKGPGNLEISNKSRYPNGQHPIMSLEQAINYEIPQVINSIGVKIVKSTMLDAINSIDQTYQNRLYSSGPMSKIIRSIGYDVVNNKGEKSYIVAKYLNLSGQYGAFVSLNYTLVTADANYIATAKEGLLHMYGSRKYDEQYLAAFNQNEHNKEAETYNQIAINGARNQGNWQEHNQKMNQLRDETNAAVSGVYNSSAASFNRSNGNILDGIRGEDRIYNPYSGQQVTVPTGNQRYFINPDNQVIGTDDAFLNETQLNWNGGNYREGKKQ